MGGGGGGVGPAEWDEADGDGIEEAVFVEVKGDAGHGVGVGGELDALEEDLAASEGADFGDSGFAEGEDDVAVLVGVLENGVAAVGFELPAGGGDGFAKSIEGCVRGEKIEAGILRIFDFGFLIFDWIRLGSTDLDLEDGTEAGTAIVEREGHGF